MKAKYIARNGMNSTEIEADSVSLIIDDGTEIDLFFRKSDGEIALSINGVLLINPRAANCVYISKLKDRS